MLAEQHRMSDNGSNHWSGDLAWLCRRAGAAKPRYAAENPGAGTQVDAAWNRS